MTGRDMGDPTAGYTLTPPEGWTTEAQPGRIVMAAATGTVVVVAMPHAAADARELGSVFQGGWKEEGVDLAVAGPLIEREDGSATMDLAGQAEGAKATGRLAFLFNPAGGGLILFALARGGDDTGLAATVDALAGTVRFTPPDTADLIEGWDSALRGRTLVYLHTYSSPGGGAVPGGGFSEREDIVLSEDGTFQRSGDFSISIGGAGGGEVTTPIAGTWQITVLAGQPMLELTGGDGDATYTLSPGTAAGEVLLDGRRYFVTDG